MAIYNPGKYYLVSVDDEKQVCCVSHLDIYNVTEKMGDCVVFDPTFFPKPKIIVEGEVYGTTRILAARDLENISYEDVLNLIAEASRE